MKKLNSKGLTLIEVLAVMVILFIVVAITMNILTSSTKEQAKQVTANDNIKQSSYALKILTKDFRRTESFALSANLYTMNIYSTNEIKKIQYKLDGEQLRRIGLTMTNVEKSNEMIADNIETFLICDTAIPNTANACSANADTDPATYHILIRHMSGQSTQTTITRR